MKTQKHLKIKDQEIIPDLIGKPLNDPFEIFVFNIKEKKFKIHEYSEQIINNSELCYYDNLSSSYCNGNNFLFISGGEKKNNEIINKFWKIDLKNRIIYDPIYISPKKNHSMIFLPMNYIFIVGGNDKKTFYIDTDNLEINEWADLKEKRIEPSLIKISNYLYCFGDNDINKQNDEKFTIEKTDLNQEKSEWELLIPQFGSSLGNLKFNQKFFGSSKNLDNDIIFLGGNNGLNDNDNHELKNSINYKYSINSNTLEVSDIPYIQFYMKEKTFIKYNNNIDFILPDFDRKNPEIIFYMKNKRKIRKVGCKPKMNKISQRVNNESLDSKCELNTTNFVLSESIQCSFLDNSHIRITNNEQYESFKNSTNNKIDINNDINIRAIEPKINISMNDENKKYIKKENNYRTNIRSNSYRNPHLSKSHNCNNDIIEVPKFHFNVNDPGNELILTRNNRMYNNYQIRNPTKIKGVQGDINIKAQSFNIPNYYHSVICDNNSQIVMNNQTQLKINNYELSGNIPGINLNSTEYKGNSKKFGNNEYGLNGVIPGIKKNNKNDYYKLSKTINSTREDYNFEGIIPGIKSKRSRNNINANINIKMDEINNPDINLNGNMPGIEENKQNVHINVPNIKFNHSEINDININLNGNSPKVDINPPNAEINSSNKIEPKINNPNININNKIPQFKVNSSKIDLNSPNIQIEGNNSGIEISQKVETPSININLNNPDNQEPNIAGNIHGININPQNPNIEMKNNISNSYLNIPIQIEQNRNINIDSKVNIPNTKINLRTSNSKLSNNYNLSGFIPGIKSDLNDIKGSRRLNGNSSSGAKIKSGCKFRSSSVIEPKGERSIKNFSLKGKIENPNFYGIIPGKKLDASRIESPYKNINLQGAISDNFLMSGVIQGKNGIISKGSKDNINFNSSKINISLTNENDSNIKSLKRSMSHAQPDIKGWRKIPDFSLYGNIPGVKLEKVNYELIGNIGGNNSNKSKDDNKKMNPFDFYLKGIIAPVKRKQNLEINQPNNKLKINSINNINNSIEENYSKKGHFHGNLNDSKYLEYNEIKGSRKPLFSSKIDNDEILSKKIDKNKLKVVGDKIIDEKDIKLKEPFNINGLKNQSTKRQSIYLTVSKLKIEPEVDNNLNNINNKDFQNESPEVEMDLNDNEIKKESSKENLNQDIEIKNEIKNNNFHDNINIELKKDIKTNYNSNYMSGAFSDEDNASKKIPSQRGNSRKKKNLPTVGLKKNNFEMSKMEVVGKLDADNVNINNMISVNVGVNGVKMGSRIIE